MAPLTYLNFDLTFESNPDGYAVRVTDSPAGQAGASFVFPFNELELENFLLRLGQRSSGTRRADSPEMELSKQFGGRLFDALFDDDVRAALRSSIRASEAKGAGLRIRLRFGGAPELADIPWEYLYDGGANRFLTLSRETPLVRYLDLSRPVEPLQVTAPLRILVMISDPSDYDRLDVEAEWQRLLTATATLRERGLVEIVRLDKATLLELQRMLRDNQFHIFHYIGHGVFDESADDGFLVLEEENGRGRKVSGQYVGTMLADHRSLRLAVLNSCEGGRSSRRDPYAGAAQSLVQQGLPAVIAMQFEISDAAAAVFAQEFYMALAGGYPVDAALAEGRRAIFATKTNAEWGIPVLFMRAADGRIFDVQAPVARPVPTAAPVPAPPVVESPVAQPQTRSSSAEEAPIIPVAPPSIGSEETTPASTVGIGTSAEWSKTVGTTGSTPNDLRMVKIIGGVILGAFVVMALIFYFVFRNSTEHATLAALLPPTISFFRAEPSQIVEGENQSVQLTWSIAGEMTDVAVIGPGIDSSLALSRTGSLLVSLDKAATFALTASNYDQPATQQVMISAASPTPAPVGGASTPAAGSVDVTVTFNSIRIIDDCDTVLTGLGEFWLDLTVNDKHLRWPETGTNEVDSGQSYAIGQSISTRVADGERLVTTGAGFEVDEFQTESMGSIRVAHTAGDGWGVGSDSQTSLAVCTFVLGFTIDAALVPESTIALPDSTPPTPVAGDTRLISDIIFAYVPPGEFVMGSNGGGLDEQPVHTVYTDGFWMMRTETTNAQYRQFIEADGYTTERFWTTEGWKWRLEQKINAPSNWTDSRFDGPEQPVVGVSWYESVAYANWLAENTGLDLRLPTEAEWEKAARGTDGLVYPWGNDWDGSRLNYCDDKCEFDWKDKNQDDSYPYTSPIGSFPSGVSPYGLQDLAGNVWEWANDWYSADYYKGSPARNPEGPNTGDLRILRGGSWYVGVAGVRSANRYGSGPDSRLYIAGFRLVSPDF